MKQRLKQATKVGGYTALAFFIILTTFILVLAGKGYVFNFRTGAFDSGGLILVRSEPVSASITLDNKPVGATPKRLAVKADRYQLRLKRDGYRDWHKAITVEPGAVAWTQYPLLIPTKLQASPVANLTNPHVVVQSSKNKYLAIAQNVQTPQVSVLESGKKELRTIFSLPGVVEGQQSSIDAITWANDNDHMLIKATLNGQPHYFVTSVGNQDEVLDLTTQFSLPLENLAFNPDNWREIYWLSQGALRRIDLGNNTVSAVLAERVGSYIATTEGVFLVVQQNNQNSVARLEGDNSQKKLIANLPASDLVLGYIRFGSRHELVLFNRSIGQVSLYPSVSEAGKRLTTLHGIPVREFSISPDMRYLLLHGDLNFATYDFEFARLYRFSLGTKPVTNLTWYDKFHVLGSSDNQTVLFEFDGGNPESLNASNPSFAAYPSSDRTLVYSVGASASGLPILQSTRVR